MRPPNRQSIEPPDIKLHCKATMTKTARCWPKHRCTYRMDELGPESSLTTSTSFDRADAHAQNGTEAASSGSGWKNRTTMKLGHFLTPHTELLTCSCAWKRRPHSI